jgi:hypothetical protein
MARERVVVETVICDICGTTTAKPTSPLIGLDGQRWQLDLCPSDLKKVTAQFSAWTANARRVRNPRRTVRQAVDEWTYLESLGFTRHRGRKSAAEAAALAKRR